MIPVIDCDGDARARGRAHGEALADAIRDALGNWEAATLRNLGDNAPDSMADYVSGFLGTTGLIQTAERLTPALVEELHGIAEGAGQPFDLMAAYNLMDEQWWYDATLKSPPPGCSLVALAGDGCTVVAQNMDLPGFMDGSQVVLRLSGPDMPDTAVLSAAGLIGLTGANAAGLGVCVNTLLMLNHDRRGLPVAFVLRHALGARTAREAAAWLAELPHASGQHYALVDRETVLSVECSAGGSADWAGGPLLLHTNHPLVSDDLDAGAAQRLQKAGFEASSHRRLKCLQDRAGGLASAVQVKALFDDPKTPLCMRPETNGGSATFAAVLIEIGADVRMRVRQGLPDASEWRLVMG